MVFTRGRLTLPPERHAAAIAPGQVVVLYGMHTTSQAMSPTRPALVAAGLVDYADRE